MELWTAASWFRCEWKRGRYESPRTAQTRCSGSAGFVARARLRGTGALLRARTRYLLRHRYRSEPRSGADPSAQSLLSAEALRVPSYRTADEGGAQQWRPAHRAHL